MWPEAPDNVCFVFEQGDKDAVERAFAGADHIARLDFIVTRVAVAPMEPRACIGEFDRFTGRYTLYTGTQGPHGVRMATASPILKVPEGDLRVVSHDMGGAFGMRSGPYCEYAMCLFASKMLDRPVKWTGDRAEGFMVDDQARDNISTAELALSKDGAFLGFRVRTTANLGAYLTLLGPHSATNNLGTLAGPYRTPAIYTHVTGVFTNTMSTGPYRGAGRPEAAYAIERTIDTAADEMGIDPAELRRRNYIAPDAFPFATGLVFTYDSGEFESNMDRALALVDYAGRDARRADAEARGKLLGIGISNVIEQSAGGFPEWAQIRFDPSGSLTLTMGTHNHGQGHETVFRQILSDRLGLEFEQIRISQGDSDEVMAGHRNLWLALLGRRRRLDRAGGRQGDRQMPQDRRAQAGSGGRGYRVRRRRVHRRRNRPDDRAGRRGQARPVVHDGAARVRAGDQRVGRLDAARAHFSQRLPCLRGGGRPRNRRRRDPALRRGRRCRHRAQPAPDGGSAARRHRPGRGPDHDGERGLGPRSRASSIAGSFMDYTMPRADDLPSFEMEINEVPTPTNPLGIKGAGEAGCVGAMPALMNAIVDALSPLGVSAIDMPATPETVWRAIDRAGR